MYVYNKKNLFKKCEGGAGKFSQTYIPKSVFSWCFWSLKCGFFGNGRVLFSTLPYTHSQFYGLRLGDRSGFLFIYIFISNLLDVGVKNMEKFLKTLHPFYFFFFFSCTTLISRATHSLTLFFFISIEFFLTTWHLLYINHCYSNNLPPIHTYL